MTSLDNYLNTTDFFSFSGLNSANYNNGYVSQLISDTNALILQKLRKVFTLTPNFSTKNYKRVSSKHVLIGNFQPAGIVDSITVTANGSGYTSVPTVQISSGDAIAKAILSGNTVTRIDIIFQGTAGVYTTPPTISITGGGGTGATATATISPAITVQRGADEVLNPVLKTLTAGIDFTFIPYTQINEPGRTYPVGSLDFYNDELDLGEYLIVTGTYGFSPSVPDEVMLKTKLYTLIKDAVLAEQIKTNTGGQGPLTESSIDKVRIGFDGKHRMSAEDAIQNINDFLNHLYNKYAREETELVTIIG